MFFSIFKGANKEMAEVPYTAFTIKGTRDGGVVIEFKNEGEVVYRCDVGKADLKSSDVIHIGGVRGTVEVVINQ